MGKYQAVFQHIPDPINSRYKTRKICAPEFHGINLSIFAEDRVKYPDSGLFLFYLYEMNSSGGCGLSGVGSQVHGLKPSGPCGGIKPQDALVSLQRFQKIDGKILVPSARPDPLACRIDLADFEILEPLSSRRLFKDDPLLLENTRNPLQRLHGWIFHHHVLGKLPEFQPFNLFRTEIKGVERIKLVQIDLNGFSESGDMVRSNPLKLRLYLFVFPCP